MANGKHPWRLEAEIKREEEEKREDVRKEGSAGKVLSTPL